MSFAATKSLLGCFSGQLMCGQRFPKMSATSKSPKLIAEMLWTCVVQLSAPEISSPFPSLITEMALTVYIYVYLRLSPGLS